MVILRRIAASEEGSLRSAVDIVIAHSWGESYPISPEADISRAMFHFGAFAGDLLVGYANVNRFAGPDGQGIGSPWLANAVVLPEWRRSRIFTRLYEARMVVLEETKETVFVASDNPVVERFLVDRGWRLARQTFDEAGDACRVYVFRFPESSLTDTAHVADVGSHRSPGRNLDSG